MSPLRTSASATRTPTTMAWWWRRRRTRTAVIEEDDDDDDDDLDDEAAKKRKRREEAFELDEEDYDLLEDNQVTGFKRKLKKKRLQKASDAEKAKPKTADDLEKDLFGESDDEEPDKAEAAEELKDSEDDKEVFKAGAAPQGDFVASDDDLEDEFADFIEREEGQPKRRKIKSHITGVRSEQLQDAVDIFGDLGELNELFAMRHRAGAEEEDEYEDDDEDDENDDDDEETDADALAGEGDEALDAEPKPKPKAKKAKKKKSRGGVSGGWQSRFGAVHRQGADAHRGGRRNSRHRLARAHAAEPAIRGKARGSAGGGARILDRLMGRTRFEHANPRRRPPSHRLGRRRGPRAAQGSRMTSSGRRTSSPRVKSRLSPRRLCAPEGGSRGRPRGCLRRAEHADVVGNPHSGPPRRLQAAAARRQRRGSRAQGAQARRHPRDYGVGQAILSFCAASQGDDEEDRRGGGDLERDAAPSKISPFSPAWPTSARMRPPRRPSATSRLASRFASTSSSPRLSRAARPTGPWASPASSDPQPLAVRSPLQEGHPRPPPHLRSRPQGPASLGSYRRTGVAGGSRHEPRGCRRGRGRRDGIRGRIIRHPLPRH